jgi:hypothetical protein
VRHGIVLVGLLALIALAGLSVFAWHVVPKTKDKDGTAVTILNVMRTRIRIHRAKCGRCFFESGKTELLAADSRLSRRSAPMCAIVLVRSSWSTRIPTPWVPRRSTRSSRASASSPSSVRFTGPGGVARAQVLVAALPETNLPTITEDERSEPRNRAVDLVVAELPLPASAASSGRR